MPDQLIVTPPAGTAESGNYTPQTANTEPSETPIEPLVVAEPVILRKIQVCQTTLSRWRAEGKIPFIKIRNRIFYHVPSVEAALLRLQRGGGQ